MWEGISIKVSRGVNMWTYVRMNERTNASKQARTARRKNSWIQSTHLGRSPGRWMFDLSHIIRRHFLVCVCVCWLFLISFQLWLMMGRMEGRSDYCANFCELRDTLVTVTVTVTGQSTKVVTGQIVGYVVVDWRWCSWYPYSSSSAVVECDFDRGVMMNEKNSNEQRAPRSLILRGESSDVVHFFFWKDSLGLILSIHNILGSVLVQRSTTT